MAQIARMEKRKSVKSEQSVVQEFLYEDLTYAIIGAAMEVHRTLGHGYLESVYEEALAHEFGLRGIAYDRQAKLAVRYKEIVAGEFRADFLVERKVVVELKALKALSDGDEAQLLNYLKGTGYRIGLLLNFGAPSLEYRRRIL
jgi:GxxExxY protein